MNDLVLITFTILLPITPAYILYRALPARASVKGPFKGLNIQLSGAFAGYFLLVLLIMGFISTRPHRPDHEVWTVTGRIKLDQNSTPDGIQLSLVPRNQAIYPDGTFEIQIAPEVLASSGRLKIPNLLIERPDCQPVNIVLDKSRETYGQNVKNVSVDPDAKVIQVKDPIELVRKQQLPEYSPSGAPPQKVTYSPQEEKQ